MFVDLPGDFPPRLFYAEHRFRVAPVVDEVEFPLCRQIVGGAQALSFKRSVLFCEKELSESRREGGREAVEVEREGVRDPRVQFFSLLLVLHQLMENGRLDVGEHHPMEEFEDASLDEGRPVDSDAARLRFVPGDDPRHDHLVRLFAEFREDGRTRMIVPAFHAGGGEDEFDERACDHEEPSLAKNFAFTAAAFRGEEKRGRRIK